MRLGAAAFAAVLAAGSIAHAQPEPRIQSQEHPHGISSEVNAVVAHPFAPAAAALKNPDNWCEILLLHLDTKDCAISADGTVVKMGVVSHYDQPASSAFRVEFSLRVTEETPTFLQVRLDAPEGPVGTSDYRILLEASPVGASHTAVRMSYSYSYGILARLAMAAYFATFGHGKVGFTVVGEDSNGKPKYIGGARGVSERNTMRYYLAVEAWLGTLGLAPAARREKSLRDWYALVERYPRQLHEMDEADYVAMKRREFARQGMQ
ncbi:MAG: hypothetical protein ACXWF0_10470 [Usitatibacter sp.]